MASDWLFRSEQSSEAVTPLLAKHEIKESDWFDFSNFPKDSKYYSEANKMIPGKFQHESPANEILEFVGLR